MGTYDDMSTRDLQKLVTERKLKTSRSKENLIEQLEAYDVDHASVPVEETAPVVPTPAKPQPSRQYTPTAWREGPYLKVAFQFSGRLNDSRKAYFEDQVLLFVDAHGLTAVGEPGWLFSQGALTLYGVEVE